MSVVKQLDVDGTVKIIKMSKAKLKAISGKLKKASKAHASQAKKIDNMIKKGPFKMKGPGKKINPFSTEYRRMTPSQRRKKYGSDVTGTKAQTDKKRAEGKAKIKSKLSKDISSVAGKLDKAIQGFFNNPRSTAAGGDKKTYVPPKRGVTSGSSSNSGGGFTSRPGDPYLYKKDGDNFITKKGKDGKEITVKPGSKAYDAIGSVFKLKKSPALAKLSASCKAAAKRKFKVYPSAYANMWAAKTQRQGKC